MAKPTVAELQARLEEVTQLLRLYGIEPVPTAAVEAEDRGDFIAHGSDQHAQFLGLIPVDGDTNRRIRFTSPRTGREFALEDEVTPFLNYADPKQIAALVLEQKVGVLETKPVVPSTALTMWRPREVPV